MSLFLYETKFLSWYRCLHLSLLAWDSWRNCNSLGFIVLRSLSQCLQKALPSLSVQRCKNIEREQSGGWGEGVDKAVWDTGHSIFCYSSKFAVPERKCHVNFQGRAPESCGRQQRAGHHERIANVSWASGLVPSEPTAEQESSGLACQTALKMAGRRQYRFFLNTRKQFWINYLLMHRYIQQLQIKQKFSHSAPASV